MASHADVVRDLLAEHGRTFAEDAGITLRDKPSPLYQLLVLTTLSSARISADIAVDAARELFAAGWRTPQRMRAATWQQRVDALGRGHYRRYDEGTATKLEESATVVVEQLRGDLRRLRPDGPDGVPALLEAIADLPRIGPVGAGIFVREVQEVWPVGPYLDDRTREAASALGLPDEPRRLATLAEEHADGSLARLAAAVVRAGG